MNYKWLSEKDHITIVFHVILCQFQIKWMNKTLRLGKAYRIHTQSVTEELDVAFLICQNKEFIETEAYGCINVRVIG